MNDLLSINVTLLAVAASLFAHPVAAGDNWWEDDGGRQEHYIPAPVQSDSPRMIEEMAESYQRDYERERQLEYQREMDQRLQEMEDRQRELEEMQRRPSYDELFNRRY